MKKLRSVNTKFWDDSYITELTPQEKLLFLYLLTNSLTNLLGIYEISLRRIEFDTALSKEIIKNSLKRFEISNKCYYIDEFIILPNFIKNQRLNKNMKINVLKEWQALPENITNKIKLNHSEPFETLIEPFETPPKDIETLRKEEEEKEIEIKKERFLNFFKEIPIIKIESIITSFKQENIELKESEIREFAIKFSLKKVADDDFYNLPKTYLSHFNNWLRIEILKVKKPIEKNITTQDRLIKFIRNGKTADGYYDLSMIRDKFVKKDNGEIVTWESRIRLNDPKAIIK